MEVVKISPRGYCHGVVSAIQVLTKAAFDESLPKPIYVLGMIVHNENVVKAFDELGIITIEGHHKTRLELLDEIEEGTIIFTAHGVSPEVHEKANTKGLHIIDASCNDVLKTQELIINKISDGYDVIYIGKNNHPETEACVNINHEKIHLITNINDVDKLNIKNDKIIITNQTTLSLWDVIKIIEKIKDKYPYVEEFKEICNATTVRQDAVANVKDVDLVIVVGDKDSNNTAKLAQVSTEIAHIQAIRIADINDVDIELIKPIKRVAVTSGASTPTQITQQVIKYLEQFDSNDSSTWIKPVESVNILNLNRFKKNN